MILLGKDQNKMPVFTSSQMAEQERGVLQAFFQGKNQFSYSLRSSQAKKGLSPYFLSPEQNKTAQWILTGKDRFSVLQTGIDTGKTQMLQAVGD